MFEVSSLQRILILQIKELINLVGKLQDKKTARYTRVALTG